MATIRNLLVKLGVEVDTSAEKSVDRLGNSMRNLGGLIAGAFAVDQLVEFGKQAFAEAEEAQKVGKLTEQVIKSTGGAAKVTADHIGELAGKISAKTGIDDEAIQSGENLLLTFTKIRNEVGKGNDVFDQATMVVTDMSKALGQDMKSSSIQVGKALNDPVKGITALSRVGVSFTAGQKAQIKNFVKTGDVMSAQKVILKELNTEFGGAAAAMATPADKAKVAWGNFKEALGTALMPVIDRVSHALTDDVIPALTKTLTWVEDNIDTIKTWGKWLGIVAGALLSIKIAIMGYNAVMLVTKGVTLAVNGVVAASSAVWGIMTGAVTLARNACIGTRIQLLALSVQTKAAAVATGIQTAATVAGNIASKAFAIGIRLVNAAMRANPIGIVITILTALVAIVIVAYKKNETFRKIVDAAWKGIKATISWVWNNIIKPIFGLIVNYYKTLGAIALWLWNKGIKPAWNFIVNGIKGSWIIIKGVFNTLKDFITKTIPNAFKTGVAAVGRLWKGLEAVAKKPVSFVVNTVYNGGIAKVWNWIADHTGLGRLPLIKGFETGGVFEGVLPGYSRKDNQLIMARSGEGILVPEAVSALGHDFIHQANAAARNGGAANVAKVLGLAGDPGGLGIPGYAGGGIVGAVGGFLGKAKDWFVNGLIKAAQAAMNPMIDLTFKTIGGTPWGRNVASMIRGMIYSAINTFRPYENELGGGLGGKAIAAARTQKGVPYSWGGGGPSGPSYGSGKGAGTRGFDCSSLMQYAWYKATGKVMPRTTYEQRPWLQQLSGPRPGAVGQPHPGHTFMSVGGGRIIEAPFTGSVVSERAASAPFWGWPSKLFDDGGVWESGTVGVNRSGKPEAVFNSRQWSTLAESGGVNITVNVPPTSDPAAVGKAVYEALKEYKRRAKNGRSLGL